MRRQIGRFCGDFRPLISRILVSPGVRAIWRLFWRPVSASKNSVPGGWALSARIRGFALPQFRVIEIAATLDIAHTQRNVIQHDSSLRQATEIASWLIQFT